MPAKFQRLPPSDPRQWGGPLLYTLGYRSQGANRHFISCNEPFVINNFYPSFRNEQSDCLRTGLLSALHYLDPGCRLNMTTLREAICAGRKVGTDIASAAIFLNKLGVQAMAFAGSYDRIPPEPLALAEEYNLIAKTALEPSTINSLVFDGHTVICAVNPKGMFRSALDCSHAMLITGFSPSMVAVHDSMREPWMPGSHGTRNCIRMWEDLEKGRAAHDHHTLVIKTPIRNLRLHRARVLEALAKGREFAPRLVAVQGMPSPEQDSSETETKFSLPQTDIKTVPFVRNLSRLGTLASGLEAMRYFERTLSLDLPDLARIARLKRHVRNDADIVPLAHTFNRLGYKCEVLASTRMAVSGKAPHKKGKPLKVRTGPLTLSRIRKSLAKNQLTICAVDHTKLYGQTGLPAPHTICIAGYDRGRIFYHENGSNQPDWKYTPYCSVPFGRLAKSLLPETPALIVRGRLPHKTRYAVPSPSAGQLP